MFKLDSEMAEEPEIKLPTSVEPTVENSSKDGDTRPPDLPTEKSVCRSRSNS